jgi:predicted Zn-ribbon and HTH transcriptional regulator
MSGFELLRGKFEGNLTVPMILHCPQCCARHIDEGEFAEVAHHTHACQGCGFVWRPAKVNTHGVQFLPGYRNEAQPSGETRS